MAWARTVAVVVPSPATSLVLLATSRTICAPMFSRVSPSSISLATVTPSLVMTGEPNFLLITTLRPRGPSVTFTASANTFTPRRIAWRDSAPCTICFAIASNLLSKFFPRVAVMIREIPGTAHKQPATSKIGWASCQAPAAFLPSCGSGFLRLFRALGGAAEDAENLLFLHDQEIFALDLDFRSGILAEQDPVALFHCQRNGLSFLIPAGANRDHNALLGLLFRCVGDDDATANRLRFLDPADKNAVMQGGQL